MAFGAAHTLETQSEITSNNEPGVYFEKAWRFLPQLLLEPDLWALKAVTLMVHYLQASAKPQACWALLGTALRVAASLGFDRPGADLDVYSDVEREEGKRAFWLCYVMEKSLCINLGRPSESTLSPGVVMPQPFVSTAGDGEGDIFGENETNVAEFFYGIIELTRVRDEMFAALQSPHLMAEGTHQLLLSRLQTIRKSGEASSQQQSIVIRQHIYNLAYNNTLQLLSTTLPHFQNTHFSDEAAISARNSLELIHTSHKTGQLMCLWMWLYYAFTSTVTLFLHSVANPLKVDTALNLAAIADFEDICERLGEVSEGARQCAGVARGMRAVIHKMVKMAGRKRSREGGDEGDEGGNRFEGKRLQLETIAPAELEERNEFLGGQFGMGDPEAVLAGVPGGFAWDEWDKWLEDVDFTGGEGS